MPSLLDAHAHLNFAAFVDSAEGVIASCQKEDIWCVMPGSQLATSTRSQILASRHAGMFAAVGQHPTHVDDELFDYEKYSALIRAGLPAMPAGKALQAGHVVAVGECGLDSFRLSAEKKEATLDRQRALLSQHVRLAKEFNLPMIIHGRGPKEDPDEIYRQLYAELKDAGIRGVLHCYLGSYAAAKPFLDLGFYVSFTGIVTFANAQDLWETAKQIPLDRLMVETDSPYLTPVPHRGESPNTPLYVRHVVEHVARLRGMQYEELAAQTVANAREFFKL